MINFYRCFLPGTLRPPTAALAGPSLAGRNGNRFHCHQGSPGRCGTTGPPLAEGRPRPAMVASGTNVGAVIQQQIGQHWQPQGFFSKKLTKTEVNRQTESSAPPSQVSNTSAPGWKAVFSSSGRITNLQFLPPTESRCLATSGRQQPHLAFISEYTNHHMYVPSTSNVVADALSCLTAEVI